jgi:hypothetical protein
MTYRDLALCGAGLMLVWSIAVFSYATSNIVQTFPYPYRLFSGGFFKKYFLFVRR